MASASMRTGSERTTRNNPENDDSQKSGTLAGEHGRTSQAASFPQTSSAARPGAEQQHAPMLAERAVEFQQKATWPKIIKRRPHKDSLLSVFLSFQFRVRLWLLQVLPPMQKIV